MYQDKDKNSEVMSQDKDKNSEVMSQDEDAMCIQYRNRVLDSEAGLECDDCQRWFHVKCKTGRL